MKISSGRTVFNLLYPQYMFIIFHKDINIIYGVTMRIARKGWTFVNVKSLLFCNWAHTFCKMFYSHFRTKYFQYNLGKYWCSAFKNIFKNFSRLHWSKVGRTANDTCCMPLRTFVIFLHSRSVSTIYNSASLSCFNFHLFVFVLF